MIIFLLMISTLGVLWLCYEAWTRPTIAAGRGTVIVLAVSLVVLFSMIMVGGN